MCAASTNTARSVLTIAGSDSSGGAGIQADLKTIAAHGCYGASVITALTAQNTTGVQGVQPTPPAFVEKQIISVLHDIETHAIKTGMLYDAECIRAVVRALMTQSSGSTLPIICDPVCVSTSGHSLLDPTAIQVLIEEFFPLTTLITPNKFEAERLLSLKGESSEIHNLQDMVVAAKDLLRYGSHAVLLKGGHLITTRDPKLVVDVFSEGDQIAIFARPHINSKSTHGTGCTLSAAIASCLARGSNLKEAVKDATIYTHLAIQMAEPIGHGHGPLNHFHAVAPRLIPRASPSDPYPLTRLLIEGNLSDWKEYVEHDFVKLLGLGTLSRETFLHFMVQDYHYLKYYARAYGLLAAKSTSFKAIESAAQIIFNIVSEIDTHKSYCAKFGLSKDEVENMPESAACTSYGAYLLDIGLQGDTTKLLMALLACLLGYGEVGLWLKKEAALLDSWVVTDGNPYKKWMDDYGGNRYQNAVKAGLDLIEARAVNDPPSPARLAEWMQVWQRCTKFERGFWDAAMAAA
ncbi:Putative hydroxymethylpyrimidine/phosphomethylpyrimidine kinase 2 [Termitomyces sp. J132]|nr:Putative hydroxymethylpyrimidine/phosphomethylpyrimidine kinase 2 [Termitomyces sp. J132]